MDLDLVYLLSHHGMGPKADKVRSSFCAADATLSTIAPFKVSVG
jgi:hypothetical protein